MEYWAHSKEDRPESEWQTIEAHSRGVAELAKDFASQFGAAKIIREERRMKRRFIAHRRKKKKQ